MGTFRVSYTRKPRVENKARYVLQSKSETNHDRANPRPTSDCGGGGGGKNWYLGLVLKTEMEKVVCMSREEEDNDNRSKRH
jgi:hypothetical protein